MSYVLPIVVSAVAVVALALTIQRIDRVLGWTAQYDGAGTFVVERCTEQVGLGADQWRCQGTLDAEGASTPLPSTLITSSGALVSDRPYVGERFDVFFEPESLEQVYASGDRLNEMTRLYLSLLPRLLFLGGALLWLAGWFSTRLLDPDDATATDSIRLPQRFQWRSRGATWMLIGLATVVVNYVVVTQVIGSLEIV